MSQNAISEHSGYCLTTFELSMSFFKTLICIHTHILAEKLL